MTLSFLNSENFDFGPSLDLFASILWTEDEPNETFTFDIYND